MTMAASSTRERAVGALGVVVAAVALGVAAGPAGAAAGALVALSWYRLEAVYAFALGQVAAAAVLGDGATALAVAGAEAGLLVLLVAPLAAADARSVVAFAAATAGLLAVLRLARSAWEPLWAAAVALGLVAAAVAYGIHRYERVQLGLVREGDPT